MSDDLLPCVRALDHECFRAHPEFARRALAYRLLHLLIPPDIARLLPKKLSDPLVAPGVEVPLGAVFPPGTVIVPRCDFPAGWRPEDEPPECAKSRPLPSLAMQVSGGNPNVFLSPGEPGTGQVHPPPGPAPSVPGSGTYYPAASGDDGNWYGASGWSITSSYLTFGDAATFAYNVWITFNGVEVPQGSTVTSAVLTFYNPYAEGVGNITIALYGNDEDSPTNPTNITEANTLALTTATVPWTVPNFAADTYYDTPDLTSIIQEIVNRSGWAANNNLMIIIHGNIATTNYRYPNSWDQGTATKFPALAIAWE